MGDLLPRAWQSRVHGLARAARAAAGPVGGSSAMVEAYGYWLAKYAGADDADMSEGSIRDRAEAIAARGRAARFVPGDGRGVWRAWERLCDFVARYGGRVRPSRAVSSLAAWAARAGCAKWWRGQLRRWVAQCYERGAYELGLIGASSGQWYCSDRAVVRRVHQVRANEAMMRGTTIQSDTGQSMTLWDVARLTVANKAIRRGELMTRIRGCEEWADSVGMVGVFTTNTAPSRFHAVRKGGGKNPKYDGSSPAEAQGWLCRQWARLRAKLAREGVRVVGFRVAEPHHDGCPHWHMMLWTAPGHMPALKQHLKEYWLNACGGDDDGLGDDPDGVRCKLLDMEAGMAAGYVAKYIGKNIDDHHISGHRDDYAEGLELGPDLLGDLEVKPCQRVEAWASLWRIRQFQAIGQPSVTAWRELRRVTPEAATAGSDTLLRAWLAVHRRGDKRADWRAYMQAQGGAGLRRDEYRLCVAHVPKDIAGRYGVRRDKWACGVRDGAGIAGFDVAPSKRRQWGGEGFAAARSAAPWTRLNNCTRHNRPDLWQTLPEVARLRESGQLIDSGPPW